MLILQTNYISLQLNLDKITEKLMHKRVMKLTNKQQSFHYKPYGFCKGFSTAHAIINLTDNKESAIDNEKFVYGVFIDLLKAFDTIDHNILLEL